jgi:hypothetical protein
VLVDDDGRYALNKRAFTPETVNALASPPLKTERPPVRRLSEWSVPGSNR